MSTPVESLLSLKKWYEDEAKSRFALSLKELVAAEEILARLEQDYEATGKKYECSADELVNIDEVKKINERLEHLLRKIHHQRKVIVGKEGMVEAARNALAEAAKEKKIFQKLDEKQKETLEKEYRRKERIGTDEHASTGHTRKMGDR